MKGRDEAHFETINFIFLKMNTDQIRADVVRSRNLRSLKRSINANTHMIGLGSVVG